MHCMWKLNWMDRFGTLSTSFCFWFCEYFTSFYWALCVKYVVGWIWIKRPNLEDSFLSTSSPQRGPRPDWDKRLCEESDLVIQTPAHPSMHEATKDTDGSGIVSDERRKSTPSPTWGGWRRNWNSRYFAVCNSNLPCFPPMLSRQTTFLTIFYKLMVEQPPGSPHGHHLRHDF